MIRPEAVAFLAEAYRHRRRSAYAALVVEHRHEDYSPAECRAALAQVLGEVDVAIEACAAVAAELDAEVVVAQELRLARREQIAEVEERLRQLHDEDDLP